MDSSSQAGGWSGAAAAPNRSEILIAVNTPITAKLIAKTLERAGHPCRLAAQADAMRPAAAWLAVIELPMDATTPPPHVLALYDSRDGRSADACLCKPIDPDLLVHIVGDRLRRGATTPAPPLTKSTPAKAPAVDRRAVEDLRRLGGDAFVREVADQFFSDADTLVAALSQHVQARDVIAFQEDAHALRSCAANIGAMVVYQLCLTWRLVSADLLAEDGASFITQLGAEVQRVRQAPELMSEECPTA